MTSSPVSGPPARFTRPRRRPLTPAQRNLQLLAAGEITGALAGAIAGGWPLPAVLPGLALTAGIQLTAAWRNRRGGGTAMALPVALAVLCALAAAWVWGLLSAPLLVLAATATGQAALVWSVASGGRSARQSRANTAGTMDWAAQIERHIDATARAYPERKP